MNLKIKIKIEIENTWYEMTDFQQVDVEEWDIEGVAAEALEALSFKMKSALNPCFWNHAVSEHLIKKESFEESQVQE
jgi:hypothetical protein